MTAIEIACRTCAAQPGELCISDKVLIHAERIEDAAMWSSPASPVAVEDFDKAILASGVI